MSMASRLVAAATAVMPASRRDWGRAIASELSCTTSAAERARLVLATAAIVVLTPPGFVAGLREYGRAARRSALLALIAYVPAGVALCLLTVVFRSAQVTMPAVVTCGYPLAVLLTAGARARRASAQAGAPVVAGLTAGLLLAILAVVTIAVTDNRELAAAIPVAVIPLTVGGAIFAPVGAVLAKALARATDLRESVRKSPVRPAARSGSVTAVATDRARNETDRARRDALLTRMMGAFFLFGSLCFVAGPLGPYGNAVGARADALTFFIGSILFTLGGASQCLLAAPERPDRPAGLASWRTAWIQSAGTLLFNLMTFAAITVAAASHRYDTVVWGPNALGSACFLVSGAIFYLSSPRRGLLPRFDHEGWWEAAVNLLGCVLFGISAVTSYATGRAGALVSTGISNWTTVLGAACFLACALTACGLGVTLKAPRLRQLRTLAREVADAVEHAVEHEVRVVEHEVRVIEREVQEARAYMEILTEGVTEEIRAVE